MNNTTTALSWTTDDYDRLCSKYANRDQECIAATLRYQRAEARVLELEAEVKALRTEKEIR